LQQRQNFLLRRRIERGGGLVGDEQRRPARNGLGQQNALPLTAAQLMRIRFGHALGFTGKHARENAQGLFAQRATVQTFVGGDHVTDLFSHANRRMQRQRGLLKHDCDAASADLLKLSGRYAKNVLSLKVNGTFLDLSICRKQLQ
jgi:hypothetical protein